MDSVGIGPEPDSLWPGQNLRRLFVLYIKNIVHSEIKVLLKTISLFLIHFTSYYPQYAVCEINKSTGKNNDYQRFRTIAKNNNFLNFQSFSFSFCT